MSLNSWKLVIVPMRPVLGAIGVALGLVGAVSAQEQGGIRGSDTTEIAPFRLTDINGYVLTGYWSDTDERASPIGGGATTTLSNITGKAFLRTLSYVYHPNLLELDLGAGPVFFHNAYSSGALDGSTSRSEFDVSARASFLREMPYRGSVYYDRFHDGQSVGPAQSLLTQSTRYGLDFALLAPVTGFPLSVDASRLASQGFGTDRIIDESVDEINFRAGRSWGDLGDTSLHYLGSETDSKSGSVGLPILATTSRTNRVSLDTILFFGDRFDTLTNSISYHSLDFTTNLAETASDSSDSLVRFDLSYRAQLAEALQTRVRYYLDEADFSVQGVAGPSESRRVHGANAGVTWQAGPNLGMNADAFAAVERGTAIDSDFTAASASVNYIYALPVGELVANYSTVLSRRDQVALEPIAGAVGERLTLTGLAWHPLSRTQVIAGTVAVHNATRTQTFVEGFDYILRVIGLSTEIQRLVGGAILDGEAVLIDYAYDTGGTFTMTDWHNTVDVAWRFNQLVSVYSRYTDTSPRLSGSAPTIPLNPVNQLILGTRADIPFTLLGEQMMAGAAAEWTDRGEVISPTTQMLYEAYLESSVPMIASSGLRFGARQQRSEYDLTPWLDVTQRTFLLRFWSRFRSGLTVHLDATTNRDSGLALVEREYRQGSANAHWRIRQVLMSFRFDVTQQTQSGADQTHTRLRFDLRRDF